MVCLYLYLSTLNSDSSDGTGQRYLIDLPVLWGRSHSDLLSFAPLLAEGKGNQYPRMLVVLRASDGGVSYPAALQSSFVDCFFMAVD